MNLSKEEQKIIEKLRADKEKEKQENKVKFSKIIVSLIIALNIAFTIAILIVFLKTGTEPSTLIATFFGFTTVELWSLAGIKKKEVISNVNNSGEQNY